MGIVLTGLTLLIFQYLIGELLKSKARGERLHHIATTDELTGLANRERFRARLDQRIASANETDEKFAVMLLDLDRFKEVNDTLGHHFGDELLRDLGPRLAEAVGPDGLVARLGGDEFAVMPAEATGDPSGSRRSRGSDRCVQQPVAVDDMTLDVGVSIGVAALPARRRRSALAAAQRRRRDVRGQGGALGLQGLRRRARPPLGAPPERAERVPARARLGRDRRLLPAAHRAGRDARARRGGAGALAAPRARAAAAVRLPADRRADRADRTAHAARARAGGGAVRGVAPGGQAT